ncbi:CBS domain-containing protein [Desulfohalobiaceae bacterium Ax17]|jgi:CBS domain-containing protein|uniref:CBS domain-containing protein n=1 Tax=Desulfovulcanus ferrireducens TaxID=2831190 RepID=UPI00207BAA7B|nr:CBS domain-containing protein [Desulfovulcanus ferrireducens]MBT8764154.1 CBS domain-containing protein [Desulfovulcanus ferrireducens]
MLVSKIMQTELVLADMESDFVTLLCKISNLSPRQIYVVDDQLKLQGIITGYDLLKVVLPEYIDSNLLRSIRDQKIDDYLLKCIDHIKEKKASEIMVRDFTYLKETDHAMEAEALIVEKRINALPVLDENGKILGEVHRRDILNYIARLCCK